jgi:hypothetical protein
MYIFVANYCALVGLNTVKLYTYMDNIKSVVSYSLLRHLIWEDIL